MTTLASGVHALCDVTHLLRASVLNVCLCRETYFMIGERHEKKTSLDSVAGLVRDAREVRKRPRRVLSEDGSHVLNIWFIPHYNELLVMYKVLDDDACVQALRHHLIIAGTLHDMMQYLCAHANLGTAQARLGSTQIEFVSSDWGGFEGVGAELREIQEQMGHIPNTPEKVGNFLKLRRDVMFLEFEVAIKYNMRDTMLSMGNKRAYKVSPTHFSLTYPVLLFCSTVPSSHRRLWRECTLGFST